MEELHELVPAIFLTFVLIVVVAWDLTREWKRARRCPAAALRYEGPTDIYIQVDWNNGDHYLQEVTQQVYEIMQRIQQHGIAYPGVTTAPTPELRAAPLWPTNL